MAQQNNQSRPMMPDSSQDTGKKRPVSSDNSSAAVSQHADNEQPSKLIKSDANPDVSFGKKPATSLTKKTAATTGNIEWRSQNHRTSRKEVMQHISCLLKQAYPNASNECLGKMPVMVQQLEARLYHSAPSFEVYSQLSTLQDRLNRLLLHFLNCKNPKCNTFGPVVITMMKYRRYNSMLTWLAEDSHDALVRALGFLDVTSLLQCEMTSKTIKKAASNAWIAVDKAIDTKKKAHGETPRQRAIRSSHIYRRHLLSKYAAKIEKLRPTTSGSEKLLLDRQSILGGDYDFYIRFATVVDEEKRNEKYEGRNHRKETMFLTGGVVSPYSSRFKGDEAINFDLASLNLDRWLLLYHILHPYGCTFSEQCAAMKGDRLDSLLEAAFLDVTSTIVAIHRKTLQLSIVIATDRCGNDADDAYRDGALKYQGFMVIDSWERTGGGFLSCLDCEHIFEEKKWTFSICRDAQ